MAEDPTPKEYFQGCLTLAVLVAVAMIVVNLSCGGCGEPTPEATLTPGQRERLHALMSEVGYQDYQITDASSTLGITIYTKEFGQLFASAAAHELFLKVWDSGIVPLSKGNFANAEQGFFLRVSIQERVRPGLVTIYGTGRWSGGQWEWNPGGP